MKSGVVLSKPQLSYSLNFLNFHGNHEVTKISFLPYSTLKSLFTSYTLRPSDLKTNALTSRKKYCPYQASIAERMQFVKVLIICVFLTFFRG